MHEKKHFDGGGSADCPAWGRVLLFQGVLLYFGLLQRCGKALPSGTSGRLSPGNGKLRRRLLLSGYCPPLAGPTFGAEAARRASLGFWTKTASADQSTPGGVGR